ncbi:MAG TPA: hypothetical protein VM531_00315 [Sphingomicrobium sp.]|jgi:hypothetical protein|nr:hypothetical protein [Sphingomicrobium sp.]
MRNRIALASILLAAGCSSPMTSEPSLAPRAAESIDPRLPIPDTVPAGPVNAELAARLNALVEATRAAAPAFNAQEGEAARLTAAAGPMASESWIAAQQALSRLVERHGIATRAAGDIDALAATRLEGQHWIRPSDREAIAAAAAEVGSINDAQAEAIKRLTAQLER